MNSTILSPKISLCMLSMMTSHSLTVDHQMLLSWSLKCSSKSISQETFSWKIHSRLVFYQESFILSRELSSFTHTRLWITWHKQSWSRINSTFLIYLDMLSHQKVIFLSSVDSTHKAENFCTKPTSSTSIDLFWSHLMTCSIQELIMWFINIKTICMFWEEWLIEMRKVAVNHSFKVWILASFSLFQARSGSCYQTLISQDKLSVFANSMKSTFSLLVENALNQRQESAINCLLIMFKKLKPLILKRIFGKLSITSQIIWNLELSMLERLKSPERKLWFLEEWSSTKKVMMIKIPW